MTTNKVSKKGLARKAQLVRAGVSQVSIARECGTSRQAVSRVLYGHSMSERIQTAIAARMGKSRAQVFGLTQNGRAH